MITEIHLLTDNENYYILYSRKKNEIHLQLCCNNNEDGLGIHKWLPFSMATLRELNIKLLKLISLFSITKNNLIILNFLYR